MANLEDLPLRDNLRGLTPYGAPQDDVPVSLNVNENTHPVPEAIQQTILENIAAALSGLNRYPDREFTRLREDLAAYLGHGLTAENIWAGNGSNEVIQHIFQVFGGPGRSALSFKPSYSMYSLIASGTDTAWSTVDREADFTVNRQKAVEAIREKQPDLVFFCSPNNPTGTYQDLDTIAAVYEETKGMVIVDEAYAEFQGDHEPSALTLLEGRPRLIVLRTMSKAFGFAGVRLGYLAADEAVTQAMRLVRLPYHLSALTQAAASAALSHADEHMTITEDIRQQRDRLVTELTALGYTPVPSSANFVLFGGVSDPNAVFTALRAQGILIRDLGIPHHLRVTAGTEEETTIFLEALAKLPR